MELATLMASSIGAVRKVGFAFTPTPTATTPPTISPYPLYFSRASDIPAMAAPAPRHNVLHGAGSLLCPQLPLEMLRTQVDCWPKGTNGGPMECFAASRRTGPTVYHTTGRPVAQQPTCTVWLS